MGKCCLRHVSQAQKCAQEAGPAPAAVPAVPAAEAAGWGAAATEEAAAAQDEGGDAEAGQDAAQVAGGLHDLEEDPDVMDGAAGGFQDGAAGADLPVLHNDGPHLATGKTILSILYTVR